LRKWFANSSFIQRKPKMPVKKVDGLKDPEERRAGQQWQKALGIPDLTTRELDYICDRHQGNSDDEIRQAILDRRQGK
jgi:hypothetical protein